MGDLFTTARYPFIDLSTGGSLEGMIKASDRVLAIINSETRVIPGHGPLGDYAALKEFRDMLVTVRDRVKKMLDSGNTLDEVIQAKPTQDFDRERSSGFLTPDDFVRIVYRSLKRNSR